jgi:hypothetical protein
VAGAAGMWESRQRFPRARGQRREGIALGARPLFHPYLNFHRPCAVPELNKDSKGKTVRTYRWCATPWEILRHLPGVAGWLKDDVTVEQLRYSSLPGGRSAQRIVRLIHFRQQRDVGRGVVNRVPLATAAPDPHHPACHVLAYQPRGPGPAQDRHFRNVLSCSPYFMPINNPQHPLPLLQAHLALEKSNPDTFAYVRIQWK